MKASGSRIALGLLSVMVIAEGVAIVFLLFDPASPRAEEQGPVPSTGELSSNPDLENLDQDEDVSRHSNEAGGFAFSVPESWEVSSEGPNSQAISPDNITSLTISSIPSSPINRSVSEVLDALRRKYTQVSVRSRTERVIDDTAAIIVRGTVVRKKSAKRFVLGAVAGGNRTHLILVFAKFPEANSVEVSAGIQEIFGSFSVLPTREEGKEEEDRKA